MTERLAIVHERFTELGGSEKVVAEMASLPFDVHVHAPIVDPSALPSGLNGVPVTPGPLQRLYRGDGTYAHLLPLLPGAVAKIDLSDADVVVTSHHAFANRVRVAPDIPVISYTHTPARWMWDPATRAGEPGGRLGASGLGTFSRAVRDADRRAAHRVDRIVVNSRTVAQRVRRWWGRDSTVVHPPIDTDFFTPDDRDREDFFLAAGRLVPYKQVELAVAAAGRAGLPLVVAGSGRLEDRLRAEAGPTVTFLGAVSDEQLRQLYRRCRALVFPGNEDFGMVPVEAQACGAPVIARGIGGATETVVDGVTGLLLARREHDLVGALAQAMFRFEPQQFDPATIRRHAEGFSTQRFRAQMFAIVDEALNRSTHRSPGYDVPRTDNGVRPIAPVETAPAPTASAV